VRDFFWIAAFAGMTNQRASQIIMTKNRLISREEILYDSKTNHLLDLSFRRLSEVETKKRFAPNFLGFDSDQPAKVLRVFSWFRLRSTSESLLFLKTHHSLLF
jgi:hypothetical protein